MSGALLEHGPDEHKRHPSGQVLEVRVAAIDALFAEFYAGPVETRPLAENLRIYLLDSWEDAPIKPETLIIHAPSHERADTDERAVRAAFRADLHSYSGPYRQAAGISHRERVSAWIGLLILLASIAISTALEQLTDNVIVAGVSQGIVVVGWVALWAPAQRFAVDILPHWVARGSYAKLADLKVRFAWDRASTYPSEAEAIEAE